MSRIEVRNPRTGKSDYSFENPSAADIAAICERLKSAQSQWHDGGLDRRIAELQLWKETLVTNREDIVSAISIDTGRERESELEFDVVVRSIDRWCALAPDLLADGPIRSSGAIPSVQISSDSVPLGLVTVISPWNFPLLLSMIDTIPALLAGCAVVVKPSEITPRFIEKMPAMPALQFVAGDGVIGASLVDSTDAVAFTGSVPTGRAVAESAARNFIPAFLELGGKDPAVVMESADIDRATSAILWGSTANAGQSCQSIERIYVASPIFESFVERLVVKTRGIELGPIIAEKQAAILRSQLRDAVDRGAKILYGGEIEERGGLWCQATVITNVNHTMKVMTEETFGPIMPVMKFESADEAVALANDSKYGLSAAVFAGSDDEALTVAARVNAGAISVHDAALTAFVHEAEKNSFRDSGLGGSRMGPSALRRFMRRRAFLVQTSTDRNPWWFA